MARQARIAPNEYIYHVLTRGNNRMDVFHEDQDFTRYMETLAKYKEKYSFKLYHYVLMTNHVHIVLEPSGNGGSLTEIMKSINLSYVQYYKYKYGHIGHFWQDRYKSIIISNDRYLLACGGYVELNPVRAKMVDSPKDYPWSSYGAYAYGRSDGITDKHSLYEEMGINDIERKKGYRAQIKGWLADDAMKGLMDRRSVYGNEAFEKRVSKKHKLNARTRQVGRPKKDENE